jgi:hypothetical protein
MAVLRLASAPACLFAYAPGPQPLPPPFLLVVETSPCETASKRTCEHVVVLTRLGRRERLRCSDARLR